MKRAMEIQVGDRVFDRGRSFKVKEILVDRDGLIHFIDMQGHLHGPYVPNEFIGVKRPGENGDFFIGAVKLSTKGVATILRTAKAWEGRYTAMSQAQQCFLCEEFCFADRWCVHVRPEQRQQWDIPRVVGGRLFTVCG